MITALLCTDDDHRAAPLARALAGHVDLRRADSAASAIVQLRDVDLLLLDPSFCGRDPAVADMLRELAVGLYLPVLPLPEPDARPDDLTRAIESALSGLHARNEVRDTLRRN